MFLFLYSILFPLVFLLYLPFYAVHFIRRGGLTVDFWERFGFFPAAVKKRLKALKAPVWLHAVSVGETVEAISFIQTWLQRHPEEELVFSCGTSTAFATALKKMPPQVVVIYCPLDCWWMVRHALNLVRPRLLAIFEEEGVSYEHTPSGIDSISVIIRGERFDPALEKRTVARIKRELNPDSVIVSHDYAVLMVVGEGMCYSAGMLARATTALASAGINISMVNQGASEISFMLGIKSADRDRAVRALYEAFFGE